MPAIEDTSTPTTSKTVSSKQAPDPTPTKTPAPSSSEERDIRGVVKMTFRRGLKRAKIEILGKHPIPLGFLSRAHREALGALAKYNTKKKREGRTANG